MFLTSLYIKLLNIWKYITENKEVEHSASSESCVYDYNNFAT